MSPNVEESYDRLARIYTVRIVGELEYKPFDRAILTRFASLIRKGGAVLDLGCGPGHVSRFLADRGIEITGVDLSGCMIDEARRLQPDIPFATGSMLELEFISEIAGIVAFYSIIHIPRNQQALMFANWHNAQEPGGFLLLSFHIGEADRHLDELWGEPVSLDFLFFGREEIERRVQDAGFVILESHARDPYPGVAAEPRRCYILAQRPR